MELGRGAFADCEQSGVQCLRGREGHDCDAFTFAISSTSNAHDAPACQGQESVQRLHRLSLNPNNYNNLANRLSLKQQPQQLNQMEFAHSFGTAVWGEPLG